MEEFRASLEERVDDREWSLLWGVSGEPLLLNRNGFELMDGYTRYTVLKRHGQKEAYALWGCLTMPAPSAVPGAGIG
ncbi:MAG TPA: hypothetical protein VFO91_07080 [Anaerolineales bacterium]|nr:hypothetical protein [Anaerolineales bacterium]